MGEFTVHSIPGSPFGRAVLATLEEKGVKWHLAPVTPGTHRQMPHLGRHPFGRVPVLEHDGFLLYETQAILRYLDRMLPEPALTPADPQTAARMDQAMGVCDWYLFQGVGNVIALQRVVLPRIAGAVADEAVCAAAMPRAKIVFDELARLLGDGPYLAGAAFSLADLHVAPHVAMMAATPEWAVLTAAHAGLVDWLARVSARPSFVATGWDRLLELVRAA